MVELHHGDCLDVMRGMAENTVDAIVCDPPYGLSFMGKTWDKFQASDMPMRGRPELDAVNAGMSRQGGRQRASADYQRRQARDMREFQAWCESWAAECLRVLKPGGYMLAFGGTRTYHRMVSGLEDAGFEIRDCIFYHYGSGFPKSHNVGKALDAKKERCSCNKNLRGMRSALDSCEPIPGRSQQDLQPDLQSDQDRSEQRRQAVCNPGAGLRDLRHVGSSASIPSDAEHGSLLQSQMPGKGQRRAPGSTPGKHEGPDPESEIRTGKPSLEGWGDDVQEEGQLQGHQVPSGSRLDEANGAQRRLHHGASDGDGGVVRVPSYSDGSGSSCQSQPDTEQPAEPGAVAGQPEPQVGGAWPVCGGCGKPMVPDGLGTALKPATEPIVLARKPLVGTVAQNVIRHGTGALNIDGCRVHGGPSDGGAVSGDTALGQSSGWNAHTNRTTEIDRSMAAGRWPANLIHDGSDEVVSQFPREAGAAAPVTVRNADKFRGTYGAFKGNIDEGGSTFHGDAGSAARFFYCAKADRSDRNDGCEDLQRKPLNWSSGTQSPGTFQAEGTDRSSPNNHPTVKPTDLMRYLCRMVTPSGGLILDPFMGSGSTGRGAVLEGFRFVGIEREADYMEIARLRIDSARRQGHQPSLDLEAAA